MIPDFQLSWPLSRGWDVPKVFLKGCCHFDFFVSVPPKLRDLLQYDWVVLCTQLGQLKWKYFPTPVLNIPRTRQINLPLGFPGGSAATFPDCSQFPDPEAFDEWAGLVSWGRDLQHCCKYRLSTSSWLPEGLWKVTYALEKRKCRDLWRWLDVISEVTCFPRKCSENP